MNIFSLTPQQLSAYFQEQGEPAYRASQMIQWIYQRGVVDFEKMSNLSLLCRQKLAENFSVALPAVLSEKISQCGTRKWLLGLPEGNAIEMVFIPDENRGTLCVSSQVGCALNCSFCATGKEGFSRDLSFGEIISQIWLAVHQLLPENQTVTNVVFMGMGEPLLNYDNVVVAANLMMDDLAFGLSKYRVTISTSGVVPKMESLKEDSPCSLAVSLHAANDALRDELVPLNKKYPLNRLMKVCRDYFPEGSRRQVMFEYVLLEGVNDSLQHAKELIQLLKGMSCKVNLIPFNSFEGTLYSRPAEQRIFAFQEALMKAGVRTFLRKTRGEDTQGACGQLAGKFKDRTGRHERWLKTRRLIPIKVESN